jgi:hypothetical protein
MDREKLYYNTREVAALYGLTVSHLKQLRHTKQGPPCSRLGEKKIVYDIRQFDVWFHAQLTPIELQA